jgi:hypothetical protein
MLIKSEQMFVFDWSSHIQQKLIMKPSAPSIFPFITPPLTHYSFFIVVPQNSAHNSNRFSPPSFSNPKSTILNPKSPHSFRGKCGKRYFNSDAAFSYHQIPRIGHNPFSPLQIRRIWGGAGGGVLGPGYSFFFRYAYRIFLAVPLVLQRNVAPQSHPLDPKGFRG